jgi:hypothetical protein
MEIKLSHWQNRVDNDIIVLGGAPSLMEDFEKAPNGVWMSCNEHGFRVCNPHYTVFLNDPKGKPNLSECVNSYTIKVSKSKYSDVDIDVPHFHGGFTGQFAVWLASFLTTKRVIICGMDLYGSQNHYYDYKRKHERFDNLDRKELQQSQIHDWERLKKYIDYKEVYAVSGILTNIFKQL